MSSSPAWDYRVASRAFFLDVPRGVDVCPLFLVSYSVQFQKLTLNGFSPVCVNMCRLISNSLAKSLPHWGQGMGPELPWDRRCSRYGSSFITSISFFQFVSTLFALEDSESDRKISLVSSLLESLANKLRFCEHHHMTGK